MKSVRSGWEALRVQVLLVDRLTEQQWEDATSTKTVPQVRIGTAISVSGTGSVNGYPCGGPLPSCCTLAAESGGIPTAQNPSSSSSGLWQFTHDTWAGYGGYSEAKYAPASVQNERAIQVFNGGLGWGNWRGDNCYPGG